MEKLRCRHSLLAFCLDLEQFDRAMCAAKEEPVVRDMQLAGRDSQVRQLHTMHDQLLAAQAAKAKGLTTVGLLGRDGGKLRGLVDLAVVVPAQTSDRIQEIHIKLVHNVIEIVERQLFPELY